MREVDLDDNTIKKKLKDTVLKTLDLSFFDIRVHTIFCPLTRPHLGTRLKIRVNAIFANKIQTLPHLFVSCSHVIKVLV